MGDLDIIATALRLLTSKPEGISEQHYADALKASNALCNVRNKIALLEDLLETIVIASKLKNGDEDLDRAIEGAAYYILTGKESKDGN